MKQHRATIRSTLIQSYILIIVVIFAAFIIFYSVTETEKISNQVYSTLEQNTQSIAASVVEQIDQMDMVSMNVAYSTLIRDRFQEYIAYGDDANKHVLDNSEYFGHVQALSDMLIAIIGPQRPVDQINLYALDEPIAFGTGLYSGILDDTIASKSWYSQVGEQRGKKVLSIIEHDSRISRFQTDQQGKSLLSLSRLYFDKYNNPLGVVEVQKSYNKVFPAAHSYVPLYGERLYIYDRDGTIYYPHSQLGETLYMPEQLEIEQQPATYIHPKTNTTEYIFTSDLDKSGLTASLIISQNDLYASVRQSIPGILRILLIILAGSIVLAIFTSRIITKPIQRMYNEITTAEFDGDNFALSEDLDIQIHELDTLYATFVSLHNKLKDSTQDQILLKDKEMQAQMLALQSQMNPHFLYNSLSTLQSMAEEGMNNEMIHMCQNISDILRYISSDKEQLVPLKRELEHTENYLQAMQVRYNEKLFYSIAIPDEMQSIPIPKLCVQLLVENAIKYSTTGRPPWQVDIRGFMKDEYNWRLSVQDNGPGFAGDQLAVLQSEIHTIDQTGLLPNLELQGMGLLNIYIRFKLIYKHQTYFDIRNTREGGAIVTIGGVRHEDHQD